MNTHDKVILISFLMVVTLVSFGIVNHYAVYSGAPYEISQIRHHLILALNTNNVDAKAQYVDDTVSSLEDWHGNGEWWFPKDDTDIDQIRELLRSISVDIREQVDVKDREGYYVLPHNELMVNLDSEIEIANGMLVDYGMAIHWNPNNNPTHWIVTPIWIIALIIFICALIVKVDW